LYAYDHPHELSMINSKRTRIRIIKHAERDARQDDKHAAEKQRSNGEPKKESSHETVNIVTAWIGELRQKKMSDLAVARNLQDSMTKTA
jgi:hypothetical protein